MSPLVLSPLMAPPRNAVVMRQTLVLPLLLMVASCSPKQAEPKPPGPVQPQQDAILRVGSIVISQADLEQQLKETHAGRKDEATRKLALEELANRAQLVQAALDAKLDQEPVIRAEFARILANKFKEQSLVPKLKALSTSVSESRLREIYKANQSIYQSHEQRQVAVLWLDPGKDPQRAKQYQEKLATARDWFFKSSDLEKEPDKGFAELGVDYSEHQASRFKGGIVGWLERQGGMDSWTKAVAEIAFSLTKPGEVSEVKVRPEGIFLVRYMALKPASLRSFESVASELERMERSRLKQQAETDFTKEMAAKYPVQQLTPGTTSKPEAGQSQAK